jgi:hypothetical protein
MQMIENMVHCDVDGLIYTLSATLGAATLIILNIECHDDKTKCRYNMQDDILAGHTGTWSIRLSKRC